MNQDEQMKLAVDCGAFVDDEEICDKFGETVMIFNISDLSGYTATVEANMRERCALECERADGVHDHLYAAAIRSLK